MNNHLETEIKKFIIIASKKKKKLVINLTKEEQDLYRQSYQM